MAGEKCFEAFKLVCSRGVFMVFGWLSVPGIRFLGRLILVS